MLSQTLRATYTHTHTQSHSRGKPYTFRIAALQQKHSLLLAAVEKKETRRTASQPIRISGDFDFSTPPLRLGRAAPRGSHPRAAIGRFSRLYGSHLNTPLFEALCGAAGSNWLNYEDQRHNGGEHGAGTLLKDLSVCFTPCSFNRIADHKQFWDSLVSFLFQPLLPVKEIGAASRKW